MPADFPDWGGQYNDKQFFPLFDQAELAARLGSLMTYDRRGSVIWQENFEMGLGRVNEHLSGTGSTLTLTTVSSESGPFSALLTTGAVASAYAGLRVYLPVPQSPLIGCQASVNPYSSDEEVRLTVDHYDGTIDYFARLIINQVAHKLQAYVSPGVVVDLAPIPAEFGLSVIFHHLKMVFDYSTHTLVRGILDNAEFDLTGYAMVAVAQVGDPCIEGEIRLITNTGAVTYCVVDNMIITAAEPPNS